MFWKRWWPAARRRDEARLATLVQVAARLPVLDGLSEAELERLAQLALAFIDGKSLVRVDDGALEDDAVAAIALQAALPVLGLGAAALADWREVILYPDAFVTRDLWLDHAGLAHEGEQVLIGQARSDGPLVLSLPDAVDSAQLDGWNVVIHEIAHKLDMLDGAPNGCPPLHKGMDRQAWARDWSAAYAAFCAELDAGHEGWLDPYAGEDPAEFFAVLSEAFFETPHWVADDYPALYRHLVAFYRQDPSLRLPRLAWPLPEHAAPLRLE